MNESAKLNIKALKVSCENCNLQELCFPRGMSNDDMKHLEDVVTQTNPLHKNDLLYRDGEVANALYAVRSGCIKTAVESPNGDEQIVGFHLPGEIVGVDGFADSKYTCNATALETTSLCVIPISKLEDLCHVVPGLQKQMRRIMGKEVNDDHRLLLMLGKMTADERLASFLLSLSKRMEERGWKADEFVLSMPRQDIANYLGVAVETVSRLFAQYQSDGLIAVDRRRVSILNMDKLKSITGECG